jgi:O-antigen/teichoic acid export membrane protein
MIRLSRDVIFSSDELSQNLAQKSVRGGTITLPAQACKIILGIAGTIVLARLLTPKDFGLIAMVAVVIAFAEMFKDAGLSMATVQKEEITHEQISTLFWINILISAALGLCVLAGSPLVAWFYGKPELTAVTAALSLSFIISGLTIQHQALQRRHMRFGTLAAIQIVSQVITLIMTISLALFGWRYWALVGGTLTNAIAGSLFTFIFCPWIPGRMRRGTGVRGMLKFGVHLTGFNFVNYFSRNTDNILIGRFIGADALGLYAKAYQLFLMPISQIRGPINNVAIPVLSSLRKEPERYKRYYQRILDIMATLTIPLAMYCLIEAKFLIHLLLGHQWIGAVPVFRILAIAGLIQAVASTRGLVLVSCGFSKRYFYYGLYTAIVNIVSFIVGLPFGIEGVAMSYTIANYVILVPLLYYSFAKTPVSVPLFFKTLLPPLASSGVCGLTIFLLKYFWPNDSFILHGTCLGIFILFYASLSLCRKSIRDTGIMILKGSGLKSVV